ncbi:hypothetical protein [Psychrobacter alimentarius]|uniref:hypothetical protein n=1 Tax=Psychrobacter alimentarius TaxID=261164 RepID=UPI003FCFF465
MSKQDEITLNGVTYDADEIYERTILVHGAQPTNFESYDYVNVLVNHKNRKEANGLKSGGVAQSEYRFGTSADIHSFNEHEYPFQLDTKMTTTSDKKGNSIQVILWADFANAREMELVPRNRAQQQKPAIAPVNKA